MLAALVKIHKMRLYPNQNTKSVNSVRNQEWMVVAEKLNAETSVRRHWETVKLRWKNINSTAEYCIA